MDCITSAVQERKLCSFITHIDVKNDLLNIFFFLCNYLKGKARLETNKTWLKRVWKTRRLTDDFIMLKIKYHLTLKIKTNCNLI